MRNGQTPAAQVFAVASAKGGVGKTTTSINLGAAFAAMGESVVVVEVDLAMANVVDFLDLPFTVNTDPTLHDVLADEAIVAAAICEAPGGFDVLPSGTALDGFAATDPQELREVVAMLRHEYDVVVLDTGAGVSYETVLPLGLADAVVLVSTPRVASVRDTRKTMDLVDRVDGTVEGIVFARSGTGNAPEVERIADFLEVDLLGHVPADDAVPAAQDQGLPVRSYAPHSPAAEAYRAIAERLRGVGEGSTGREPRLLQ